AQPGGALPAPPAPDGRSPAPADLRLRGQGGRPSTGARRRHLRAGGRRPERDRPSADRDRWRSARRAEATRVADQGRTGQGAAEGWFEEGSKAPPVLEEVVTPKLFGTDGVRGLVGRELTAELALALGRAVAMESATARPQVLIVRDTRESGPMLEAALAAGVAEGGGDAWLAGVLPTPAASILVRRHGLDLAAVVSASHNPWRHNGIKFFGANGRKLEDEAEARIEERVVQGGS